MAGLLSLLVLTPLCLATAPPPLSSIHSYMSDKEVHYYFGKEAPSNYEVITLTASHPARTKRTGAAEGQPRTLNFKAMGQEYSLILQPNRLLAPFAVVGKRGGRRVPENITNIQVGDSGSIDEPIYLNWNEDYIHLAEHEDDHKDRDMSMDELLMDRKKPEEDCQYIHQGDDIVAAISLCDGVAQGLVIAPTHSLEIIPLNTRLKRMLNMWDDDHTKNTNETIRTREPRNFHIVKRGNSHETRPYLDVVKEMFSDQDNSQNDEVIMDRMAKRAGGEMVVETAVFLDSAAYRQFSAYFRSIGDEDPDKAVQRLVLGYMNGIQALYMLPSLGRTVKFSIVRLELWQSDPSGFNHYQGDREPLLDSFCRYQEKLNSGDDTNPGYWDLALYVSGLNFYALDSAGRKDGVTMGLARVGGVCHKAHACVIGELGVTTDTGKPYPSAGFTSVYVMAHEIGHNLGMSHDHKEGCDRNGYIMSESRGTKGESQWSSCSVNSLTRFINDGSLSCLNDDNGGKVEELGLDSNVYPGEVWSANAQCQIFLLDSDAHIDHIESDYKDMCYSIKCRTPKREGYYRAGPGLEGTACGEGKWCRHGECVVNDKPKEAESLAPGTWSDWSFTSCQSGCLSKSLGYRTKRRACQRGRYIHTLEGCRGPTTGMDFCTDDGICSARQETDKYASEQCAIFSSYVAGIDNSGIGVQVKYSDQRLWQSCAIYCKRSDTGQWYTPRLELNDLPISPYFPDGTLCHQDGSTKYYCQKNTCLEQDSRVAKQDTPDLDVLFNAVPEGDGDREPPQELEKYFTLDANLDTVGGEFAGLQEKEKDDDWEVIDYLQ